VYICVCVWQSVIALRCPKNNHSRIESPKNQSEMSLEADDASDSINSSETSDSDTDSCTDPCLSSRVLDGVSAKSSFNDSDGSHPGAKLRCLKTL